MTDKNESYAVFIDLDGTLITDGFVPPAENVRAIERAREKGHKVFVNTGRSLANIPAELRRYALTLDGIITGNGSHILLGGREIHAVTFSDGLLEALCRFFLEDENSACLFEGVDALFALGAGRDFFGGYDHLIESLDDCREKLLGRRVSVIAVRGVPAEECLRRFGDHIDVFRYGSFFDCFLRGCSKAEAIELLLSAAGLPIERTIGIGDGANDLPMLRRCAVGVAMGNASDELKEAADFVTGTNRAFGVAAAIERLLL